MKVTLIEKVVHQGETFAPGEHDLDPMLAGAFIHVGWAVAEGKRAAAVADPSTVTVLLQPEPVTHDQEA